MSNKIYSGIGSRKTPQEVLCAMFNIARMLAAEGWKLRSGGAKGADTAFEDGHGDYDGEIYLSNHCTPEAMALAEQFHPAWHKCTEYVRKLHGRNAMIILGKDLATPSNKVICWTPNGKIVGGTGLGIRIAQAYDIPVYNLGERAFKNG